MLRYPRGHRDVKLCAQSWKEWQWWEELLSSWVGSSLFTFREWRCSADLDLQTDASGSWGCGAVWGSSWMAVPWRWSERRERVVNIAILELVPILLAAEAWGDKWSRMKINFETDNKAVACAGTSWSPRLGHLAKLLRILARIAIRHNFEAKFSHIPGKSNVDADDLSRGRLEEFRRRNPGADRSESTHSRSLLESCLTKN